MGVEVKAAGRKKDLSLHVLSHKAHCPTTSSRAVDTSPSQVTGGTGGTDTGLSQEAQPPPRLHSDPWALYSVNQHQRPLSLLPPSQSQDHPDTQVRSKFVYSLL